MPIDTFLYVRTYLPPYVSTPVTKNDQENMFCAINRPVTSSRTRRNGWNGNANQAHTTYPDCLNIGCTPKGLGCRRQFARLFEYRSLGCWRDSAGLLD